MKRNLSATGRGIWVPKILAGLGGLLLAAHGFAAPVTVVTPTDLQGWVLDDGYGGAAKAQITGVKPSDGNGSLQFNINAGGQQPLAVYGFGPGVSFSDLLSGNTTLGFSYLAPVGTIPNGSPTIRLLIDGLTGAGTKTYGSLGWYDGSADTGNWTTQNLSTTNGNFFFRVAGLGGQANLGCTSGAGSFDDRRQTLADWGAACTGVGGTVDLINAQVVGIEVDWGSFPGNTSDLNVYADGVNFNIGTYSGNYNFEVSATSVPEPGSLALVALGLVGVAALRKRQR